MRGVALMLIMPILSHVSLVSVSLFDCMVLDLICFAVCFVSVWCYLCASLISAHNPNRMGSLVKMHLIGFSHVHVIEKDCEPEKCDQFNFLLQNLTEAIICTSLVAAY